MDITSQIQDLFTRVPANGVVRFPASLFVDDDAYIVSEIVIPENVHYLAPEIETAYAKIRLAEPSAGFLVRNSPFLIINGVELISDPVNTRYALLSIIDSENVTLWQSKIRDFKPGQSGVLVFSSSKACKNIVIRDSEFTNGKNDSKDCLALAVRSKPKTGEASARETWLNHKRVIQVEHASENIVIRNNNISGGYYGISFNSVIGGTIENNRIVHNTRGISMQDGTCLSTVRNNAIQDNLSSGIHLAYGSCDNMVCYNTVYSARAKGEGVLQAYVGSKRNIFFRNSVNAHGAKWLVYSGIHSDDCVFSHNILEGHATKAVMAIESAWSSNAGIHPGHRGAEAEGFFNKGMSGVRVQNNLIHASSDTGLGIFLSGFEDMPLEVFEGQNTLARTKLEKAVSNHISQPGTSSPPPVQSKPWTVNTDVRPADTMPGYDVTNLVVQVPALDHQQSFPGVK